MSKVLKGNGKKAIVSKVGNGYCVAKFANENDLVTKNHNTYPKMYMAVEAAKNFIEFD